MPTIEIASLNSSELNLNPANFRVAIIQENTLESHRGLFYDFLIKQSGVIVHIGNPDLKFANDGGFFAGEIVDWTFDGPRTVIPESLYNRNLNSNHQFKFQFLEEFKADIDRILKIALEKSPVKRIFFLTDYQFGPDKANQEVIYTINDFWNVHDSLGLAFNTLYEMYGE